MPINIISIGSAELKDYLESVPKIAEDSIRMAINKVAGGKGMTRIKKAMTDEIAFPSGYLNGDRLRVTKRATGTSLEAIIVGRKRATSLARFVTGGAMVTNSKTAGGVQVRVKKGKTTYLKNAFLVRLNRGASLSEDNYNIGLAVRLKPGETLGNKRTQHQAWLVPGKVALLYAPSVDQVFATVSEKVSGKIADDVAAEFHRNFARLSK
ncbi:tail component Z [Xanthomonas phage XAP3]|nr:tail component Z [Xanthomonas phage XAP3]